MRSVLPLALILMNLIAAAASQSRPRARDLGIAPGAMDPGAHNAITDVAGVRVGHTTIVDVTSAPDLTKTRPWEATAYDGRFVDHGPPALDDRGSAATDRAADRRSCPRRCAG